MLLKSYPTIQQKQELTLQRFNEWIAEDTRLEPRDYKIEFSCGQIEYDPGRHESIEDLLAEADSAMYRNKNASR